MAGDAAIALRKTFDEYLAMERASDVRLQWVAGEVFAMAGETPEHSLVKSNLVASMVVALRGKPCLALDSDQKVDILEGDLATYPDLTVVCGPLARSPRDPNALTNPTLVVEVISPSTEAHDLGFKTRHYKRLASLRQILFVWPEERAVQLVTRGEAGAWIVKDIEDEEIVIGAIDVTLKRSEVFARLEELGAVG
ncbi:MAG: Uma2 family endonuclease [Polyangiales bacterium]